MSRYWGDWVVEETTKNILGYTAFAATMYFFVSPVTTAVRICKMKQTEDFAPDTYITTLLNCSLWVVYAYLQGALFQSLLTNAIGCGTACIWLLHYTLYASSHTRRRIVKILAPAVVVEALIVFLLRYFDEENFYQGENRSVFLFGLLADLLNIILYASPLSVVRQVIRTKSTEAMPLPVCLGVLACSLSWTCYGVYVGDVFVTVPNVLGTLLGLFQIGLHIVYRAGHKHATDDYIRIGNTVGKPDPV